MTNNGTIVYRELNDPGDALLTWLDDRGQLFNVLDDEQKEHLYVDNDVPRDILITPLIVAATKGFALFTEDGKHLADYKKLFKAEKAQLGARLVITPEVDLDDDEDEDEE